MATEPEQNSASSAIPEPALAVDGTTPDGAATPVSVSAEETSLGDTSPELAGTDAISAPQGSVSSVWKWVLGVAIVGLLAYPIIHRMSSGGADAPGGAEAQLSHSLQAYQAGQFQEAADAAQAALKINPNYALAYNNLAVSYLQLKKYDEALQAAQQAVRLDPNLELAKNNLAWIQREKAGAPPPAPPAPLAPGTADYYVQQSLDFNRAGKFQESIDAAQQALKLAPNDALAYNNIAAAYASLGNWDKAIENAQKALKIQPDFQLARNNLNWALSQKPAGKK